jgi:predicted flap endonuclease-1-like 5' DNA nuclease
MRDGDGDTTIGVGGWGLVLLSAVVTFAVLHKALHYLAVPSALFSLAIALIVLLLLHRLAAAVGRYEDEEEASRVRRIVPASAETGGRPHQGASGAMAVPVRPEAGVVPQRPSSVMTPLARVEAPPVIQPLPVAAPAVIVPAANMPAGIAPVPAAPPVAAEGVATAAAKPKAKAAPKAVAEPKAAKAKGAAEPKPKAEAKPKAEKAAKPKAAKPEGLVRLKAPRKGRADELQEIEGIGPALEKLVNSLGFYHFDQIAAWSEADIATVDAEMKTFKGRIKRDKWVEQARIIVAEGLEAFRERARTNDY